MLRLVFASLVLLLLGPPAASAQTVSKTAGPFTLGKKVKGKAKPVETEMFGCKGSLYARVSKKKVVEQIVFDANEDGCPLPPDVDPSETLNVIAASLTTELGEPVKNERGDYLWSKEDLAVILTTQDLGPGGPTPPQVRIVPPVEQRICWPDDGFAEFYANFRTALATPDAATLEPFLKFPFKDDSGNGLAVKSKKAFAKKFAEVFAEDIVKSALENKDTPWCSIDDNAYWLFWVPGGLLRAERVKGEWKFVKVMDQPVYGY